MFEKIFGIFRKRKKSDAGQEMAGETEEGMFDLGDTGLGEDFDADTISLETGLSDGGFSGSSGAGEAEGPDFGEPIGVTTPPPDEDLGLGIDETGLETGFEDEGAEAVLGETPISPPPEVEAYEPPKPKRAIAGIIGIAVVAVVSVAVGFLAVKPAIEGVKNLLSSGPTPAQQLAELEAENTELESQLTVYRAVGTIDEIVAVRDEVARRREIANEMSAIESKIADRASVDDRLDRLSARLDQTEKELLIQKGTLANVQKAIKQTEARNSYLISSTRKHLDQIEQARIKSEKLKAQLEPERIERAEAEAWFSRDIQEELDRVAIEALSSS